MEKVFCMPPYVVEYCVHTREAGLSGSRQMYDLFWNGTEFLIILLYIEITHGCG